MDLGSGATGPPAIADHMLRLGWEDRHSTGCLGKSVGGAECRVQGVLGRVVFMLSSVKVVGGRTLELSCVAGKGC